MLSGGRKAAERRIGRREGRRERRRDRKVRPVLSDENHKVEAVTDRSGLEIS